MKLHLRSTASSITMEKSQQIEHLRRALLLSGVCLLIYILFMRYAVLRSQDEWRWSAFVTGNELAHFSLVRAITEEGTFILDDFRPPGYMPGDSAYYRDHYYANKPPGFALLATPGYAVYFYFLQPLFPGRDLPDLLPLLPAFLVATSVGLTYLLALELGAQDWSAFFCAVIIGLGTALTVYAVTFMSHAASVFFLLMAFWGAFRYRATGYPGWLWGACFFLGYSVLINLAAAAVSVPLGFYLLWLLWSNRHKPTLLRDSVFAFVAGSVPLIFLGYYNYICFDNPFITGYNHYLAPAHVDFQGPLEAYLGGSFWQGLWGFLFSGGRGIFVYTPVLLLAIPGTYFLFRYGRRHRIEITVIVITIILNIVVYAPYRYWFGGHSFGARHILPIVPLIGILMFPVLERFPRRGRRCAFLVGGFSVGVNLILALLSHDAQALDYTWLEQEGHLLGQLYTEILPFIYTTTVDFVGLGLFRIMKLVIFIILITLSVFMGWSWERRSRAI